MATKKTTKKPSGQESLREGHWTKLGVIIAGLGLIIAYLGLASQTHWPPFGTVKVSASNASPDTRSPSSPSSISSAPPTKGKSGKPTAHFSSPKNDAMIGLCYTAAGTSANIAAGKVLWLVVLAPNRDDTKPTVNNLNGGQPYVAEVLHVSASGNWGTHRLQLGDPGDVRPYWLDLYMADPTIPVPGAGEGAQFSLLQHATFLSEIHVQRVPAPAGTRDGSC